MTVGGVSAGKEVVQALTDLLNADTRFKTHVVKNDFSQISDAGDVGIVIRLGSFTNEAEAFGRVYAVTWSLSVDVYRAYTRHIEEDVDELTLDRDTIIDIIQKNIYLGKGAANADGIEFADITSGDDLAVVLGEDEVTVTHFTFSLNVNVRQQRTVTSAE